MNRSVAGPRTPRNRWTAPRRGRPTSGAVVDAASTSVCRGRRRASRPAAAPATRRPAPPTPGPSPDRRRSPAAPPPPPPAVKRLRSDRESTPATSTAPTIGRRRHDRSPTRSIAVRREGRTSTGTCGRPCRARPSTPRTPAARPGRGRRCLRLDGSRPRRSSAGRRRPPRRGTAATRRRRGRQVRRRR